MPLFEFFRVAKEKLDLVQEKTGACFAESSSRTEDKLIELGWENGGLRLPSHGSSSYNSRASKPQPLNLNNVDHEQDNLKVTKPKNPNNLEEFPPWVELGTRRNDHVIPWLINFSTQIDYNTYFSTESVAVKGSSFEPNSDPLLRYNFSASGTTSPSCQLYPPMPPHSLGSQAIDSVTTNELPGPSSSNTGSASFACFSRPFALMSSSIDKADGSGVHGRRDKEAFDVPNIMFDLSKTKVKPTEVILRSSLHSGLNKSAAAEVVDESHENNLKRKSQEDESSEDPSEDVEGESVSVKKHAPNGGTKGKRTRSAEVHNLSERKRRDRINEKMRALQELIPNCNKVDKASMLDEAIEYLKSLQLQLQIMTMGVGMYLSPMIMQHMDPTTTHCPNIGIGIGTLTRPLMSGPSIAASQITHSIRDTMHNLLSPVGESNL